MLDSNILTNITTLVAYLSQADNQEHTQEHNREQMSSLLYLSVSKLIDVANEYGFEGNLWKAYITYLLVVDENAYSKSCETLGKVSGSIDELVAYDFKIIRDYYHYDLQNICAHFGFEAVSILENYKATLQHKKRLNSSLIQTISNLSKDLDLAQNEIEFKDALTDFYKSYGVGQIGLHRAFRIDDTSELKIVPIQNIANVKLDDLVGYEIPKTQLVNNTKAFIQGQAANNCLLYGDAGTGKSTCIKAIANEYYKQGLRIIEIYKHQFKYLNDIISQIKNRNYKFIIYLDDLSFEEFEIEYKYLKAIIEGSLEKRPDNILVYATSNRRHLIKETFADRQGMDLGSRDINTTETMQEKMSLASRFGESIYFGEPSREEFLNIVSVLAKRNNINISEDELKLKANQWELRHCDMSGRTAQQFINHLAHTHV